LRAFDYIDKEESRDGTKQHLCKEFTLKKTEKQAAKEITTEGNTHKTKIVLKTPHCVSVFPFKRKRVHSNNSQKSKRSDSSFKVPKVCWILPFHARCA
jgi:hypothetical protein